MFSPGAAGNRPGGEAMAPLPLADWRDFYVTIGTASGAIVGATFIVATLAAGLKERMLGLRGFITPTTVHLGSVLVGSAILCVPTLTREALAVLLGTGGLAGVIYGIVVATRIWRMNLDLADRSAYVVLPIMAYGSIACGAGIMQLSTEVTFDILGAALVVLLVLGMRNAWDMATFMLTRSADNP